MISEKIPAVSALSAADKLTLATELWEELDRAGENLPVSADQKDLLDERYACHGDSPSPGSSWAEVKERLLNRIGE